MDQIVTIDGGTLFLCQAPLTGLGLELPPHVAADPTGDADIDAVDAVKVLDLDVRADLRGSEPRACVLIRLDGPSWMLLSCIFYRLLAGLARLAVRSGRSKDLEIVVPRHQVHELRRHVD